MLQMFARRGNTKSAVAAPTYACMAHSNDITEFELPMKKVNNALQQQQIRIWTAICKSKKTRAPIGIGIASWLRSSSEFNCCGWSLLQPCQIGIRRSMLYLNKWLAVLPSASLCNGHGIHHAPYYTYKHTHIETQPEMGNVWITIHNLLILSISARVRKLHWSKKLISHPAMAIDII